MPLSERIKIKRYIWGGRVQSDSKPMNYIQYLDYLLDIKIDYGKYMNRVHFFFVECLEGDAKPIIKDLDKLLEKPIEKFTKRDWESTIWILYKINCAEKK